MVSSGVGAMMAGSRLVVMMVQGSSLEQKPERSRKEQEEVVGEVWEVRDNWEKGRVVEGDNEKRK